LTYIPYLWPISPMQCFYRPCQQPHAAPLRHCLYIARYHSSCCWSGQDRFRNSCPAASTITDVHPVHEKCMRNILYRWLISYSTVGQTSTIDWRLPACLNPTQLLSHKSV